MSSPTQRSKNFLQKQGYEVAITERWNAFAKVRVDLFGFLDLLALKENEVLGVQTTSASNMSARIKKIQAHENYPKVKASGIRVVCHGWKKKKNGRYELKSIEL